MGPTISFTELMPLKRWFATGLLPLKIVNIVERGTFLSLDKQAGA